MIKKINAIILIVILFVILSGCSSKTKKNITISQNIEPQKYNFEVVTGNVISIFDEKTKENVAKWIFEPWQEATSFESVWDFNSVSSISILNSVNYNKNPDILFIIIDGKLSHFVRKNGKYIRITDNYCIGSIGALYEKEQVAIGTEMGSIFLYKYPSNFNSSISDAVVDSWYESFDKSKSYYPTEKIWDAIIDMVYDLDLEKIVVNVKTEEAKKEIEGFIAKEGYSEYIVVKIK